MRTSTSRLTRPPPIYMVGTLSMAFGLSGLPTRRGGWSGVGGASVRPGADSRAVTAGRSGIGLGRDKAPQTGDIAEGWTIAEGSETTQGGVGRVRDIDHHAHVNHSPVAAALGRRDLRFHARPLLNGSGRSGRAGSYGRREGADRARRAVATDADSAAAGRRARGSRSTGRPEMKGRGEGLGGASGAWPEGVGGSRAEAQPNYLCTQYV